MADIQIIVGYETVTQADQAFKILDKTVNSTARQYEQAFNRITGWQKKFSNEQNKVNASLNTQHLAQQKSNKSARESAKVFEDVARAVEKEAAALRSLRMATDSVYRNQQKRLQMKKLLKSAIAAETMTTEQAIVALKRYNAAQMSSTKIMGAAKNKMNGNNVAIQQLGYQFGDFAVQVQGGTSAFVAFSQQGAQLAGILPMIAGPLGLSMRAAVGLSAALGVLIPVGSAIGRMFFEMRDSAKEAAKGAETLDDKLKSLNSTLEDYANTLAAIAAGTSLDELFATRGVKDAVKELADAQAQLDALVAASKPIQANLSGVGLAAAPTFDLSNLRAYLFGTAELAEASEKLIAARTRLQLLLEKEADTKASNFAKSSVLMKQELELLEAQARYGEDSAQAINTQLAQELRNRKLAIDARVAAGELDFNAGEALKRQVEQAAALAVQIEANAQEQERLDSAAADAYEQEERRQKRNASVVAQLHRVRQTQQRETREEQTRINALEAKVSEYAKNNNWEKTQLKKTTQQILDDAIKVHKQEKAIREELGDAAVNALKLAGVDVTSGIDSAAKAAGILMGNLGISFKTAKDIMSLSAKGVSGPSGAQYSSQDKVVEGQVGDRVGGLYGVVGQLSVGDGFSGGGSGGASDVVNINEIIEARKEQIAQDRVLLGMSGQQQAAQKVYYDLLKQNEKADIKLTQTELKGAAQAIAAQEEQNRVIEENRKQQEDLADFVANSMGDALMSIVDGTMTVKDAFKSMASDIIKELYRVLVVERMVQSIKGFLSPTPVPNANGNAFSNGSIQAYANGGVVGGPTYFPMSGGKTGLMGEAGPEAIMPLKRGANGKLGVQMEGGGQSVVVNQSFNFSANGDDSVKKIIAQAAPKIAQMTKSSLLDDRRRGGSTKAAFG